MTLLAPEMADSLLVLKIMDKVKPGVVDWKKRVKLIPKTTFDRIANANYAIELGKAAPFKFSLVGIDGQDIVQGNLKLCLALTWQLMRFHVTSFLSALEGGASDADILRWANAAVAAKQGQVDPPPPLASFKDKGLSSGLFLLALIAAVEARAVDPALVTAGATAEEKALNAKYAISCARKLGCTVFCLWEDVTEVNQKMMMVFVASLMAFASAAKAAGK